MTRTIRVDDEVYSWLQRQARPFEDTPNTVLRRIAGFDLNNTQRVELPSEAKKSEAEDHGQAGYGRRSNVMNTPKFDETDRERTIEAVEEHYGTTLSRRGSRRKSLIGANGTPYWVLGGYEDWHGVPADMIQSARDADANGNIIIACKRKNTIKVYCGLIKEFIDHIENFTPTKKGDRHFNLDWSGDRLSIKEAPRMHLELIGEFDYTKEQKEKDMVIKQAKGYIDSLSPEQLRKFLDSMDEGIA